jgi:TRAP-type mannitol/chloroaromatic compound transport system permease small subunit
MSAVLSLLSKMCRLIDTVNDHIGRAAHWLVLVAVIISSGNAAVRYLFDTSSNAWLEVQWYLFSCIVLLCGGYALLRNEHVRIDILFGRLSSHARSWVDILGGLFFLLPICLVVGILSWPMFTESYVRHEVSGDAGGLLRWPVKLLIPVGFFLLAAQGISEIVKRIAFLRGLVPDPAERPSDREAAAPRVHQI